MSTVREFGNRPHFGFAKFKTESKAWNKTFAKSKTVCHTIRSKCQFLASLGEGVPSARSQFQTGTGGAQGKFACRRGFQSGSAKCEPAIGYVWAFSFASTPGRHLSSAGFEAIRAHSAMRASLACTARHLAASRSVASRVAWRRLPRLGSPGARVAPRVERGGILRSSTRRRPSARRPEDAVLDSPRAHGDERVPGETQVGRRAVHGPDAVRHAAHGAGRGAGEWRCARAALHPEPQLLVASPLRRAMRTADLAFGLERSGTPNTRPRACVHARERVFHASDVGRPAGEVQRDFPEWCVNEMRAEFETKRVVVRPLLGGRNRKKRGRMRGGRDPCDVIPEPRDGPGARGVARPSRARFRGAHARPQGLFREHVGVAHRDRRAGACGSRSPGASSRTASS